MNKEYTNNPIVKSMTFSQDELRENTVLNITIFQDNTEESLSLIRPYPIENSYELFEADRIWIELDNEASQVEYGNFKVSYYSNEAYNEFWCDSIKEK